MSEITSGEIRLEGPFIFLDVDGVLTMSRSLTLDFEDTDDELFFPEKRDGGDFIPPLERLQLMNLAWLVGVSKAKIVLSSTWRGMFHASMSCV